MLKPNAVIDPRIIYERIDSPMRLRDAIDRFPATSCRTQIDPEKIRFPSATVGATQFASDLLSGFLVTIQNNRNRPFLRASSRDRGANSLGASRNHDNLPAELQIHETLPLSTRQIKSRLTSRFTSKHRRERREHTSAELTPFKIND
jgi:hypothetical protein